jgi:hypothetical protein
LGVEKGITMLETRRRPSVSSILAVLFGVIAVASLSGLKQGFAPPAMRALLFFSIGFALVAAAFAITPEHARESVAEPGDGDLSRAPGDESHSYRRLRLIGLGVADETADLLAAESTVSVHEMERLVRRLGCPVETAVRIVWPV